MMFRCKMWAGPADGLMVEWATAPYFWPDVSEPMHVAGVWVEPLTYERAEELGVHPSGGVFTYRYRGPLSIREAVR